MDGVRFRPGEEVQAADGEGGGGGVCKPAQGQGTPQGSSPQGGGQDSSQQQEEEAYQGGEGKGRCRGCCCRRGRCCRVGCLPPTVPGPLLHVVLFRVPRGRRRGRVLRPSGTRTRERAEQVRRRKRSSIYFFLMSLSDPLRSPSNTDTPSRSPSTMSLWSTTARSRRRPKFKNSSTGSA